MDKSVKADTLYAKLLKIKCKNQKITQKFEQFPKGTAIKDIVDYIEQTYNAPFEESAAWSML